MAEKKSYAWLLWTALACIIIVVGSWIAYQNQFIIKSKSIVYAELIIIGISGIIYLIIKIIQWSETKFGKKKEKIKLTTEEAIIKMIEITKRVFHINVLEFPYIVQPFRVEEDNKFADMVACFFREDKEESIINPPQKLLMILCRDDCDLWSYRTNATFVENIERQQGTDAFVLTLQKMAESFSPVKRTRSQIKVLNPSTGQLMDLNPLSKPDGLTGKEFGQKTSGEKTNEQQHYN